MNKIDYKKMGRIYWFFCEIYKVNIYFVINNDLKSAYFQFNQAFDPGSKECLCYVKNPEGLQSRLLTANNIIGAVIWLPINYTLQSVIHEIYHLVNYIMSVHSIQPATFVNDEHYAYLIEYIFKNFLDFEDSWEKNGKYEGPGCHLTAS